MKKQTFNHMLALATTMALVSGSQAVYAQKSADAIEEVLVTGFRASLQNSISAFQFLEYYFLYIIYNKMIFFKIVDLFLSNISF